MDETELAFAGIARQAELLRAREITSVELVELYLARIERINPKLNAFTEVFGDKARAAAADADRRLATGTPESNATQAPLLGVPIALKDEIEIEGLIAQHGTCAYSEPACADATHWRRLREAGAILLGKTTLPELAICGFTESKTWGATRNPWNTAYTPGGSSGGSGAAVAAGLVGAASASDGAGSIRIPAACNGLFGLKPQRDRISLAPHRGHWLGLSVSGCLTRRVRDTALWMDIAHGPEPGDIESLSPPAGTYMEAAARNPGELRICWSLSTPRAVMPPLRDPAIETAVKRVACALGRLGHRVSERDPDWGLIGYDCVNVYLKGIETDYDQVPHPERLESRTRGFKRLARLIPGPLLRRSQARELGHAERITAIFEHCDLLLTPVTAMPPVKIGHWAELGAVRTAFSMSRVYPHTIAWNYLCQPAASIPAGSTPEGLPLAVQLVVPPNREDLLISLAAQLEDELGWSERRPPLSV